MQRVAEQSARRLLEVASTASQTKSIDGFAFAGARGFANNKTSTGPHGGSGSSPNTSKDNPPPQSPMEQSMEVSPEVPQHEAADKIPRQVPDQIDGKGRFPDALESDTTATNETDKALPKHKAV